MAVHDRTLKDWTALPRNNQVGQADAAKELGRLLFALDLLAAHYSVMGGQVPSARLTSWMQSG